MERRWYKVWPTWVPKTVDPEKPVSEYIRDWARCTPDRVALNFYGRDITYRELNTMIDNLTAALVDAGVAEGERVAVHMENCPQFVISYFAVHRAGGVVVPVNPMFKAAELEHEMNDAGAETYIGLDFLYAEMEKVRSRTPLKRVILASMGDFLPVDPALPVPQEGTETARIFADTLDFLTLANKPAGSPVCRVTDMRSRLAVLQYTGGTTGTPKGAMISHHALAHATLGLMHWYHHREDDIHLGVTPFFHVMGQLAGMCSPMLSGGKIVILSRFVPPVVARAITLYRCTCWVAATTMVIALLDVPDIKSYDFTSFRCLWSGGAPISVELQKKLKELAPQAVIGEGYGLSETIIQGGVCTPLHQYRPGFVGIPQVNVDLKIVDQQTGTKELGPNEEGEIAIKAESMMLGYWNRPDETKTMLRGGWLYTGDTGLMDEDGYVKFLGRTREMIKCSGFSVFPAEVEDLLYRHPAVKEVAVIGVDDDYRGQSPKAFIVTKDQYADKVTEKEILDWCKENMAAYKRPRFVTFRTDLPKSSAGKLLRRVLVEEEQSGRA